MATLELFCDDCNGVLIRKTVTLEPSDPDQLIRARVPRCPCMDGEKIDPTEDLGEPEDVADLDEEEDAVDTVRRPGKGDASKKSQR